MKLTSDSPKDLATICEIIDRHQNDPSFVTLLFGALNLPAQHRDTLMTAVTELSSVALSRMPPSDFQISFSRSIEVLARTSLLAILQEYLDCQSGNSFPSLKENTGFARMIQNFANRLGVKFVFDISAENSPSPDAPFRTVLSNFRCLPVGSYKMGGYYLQTADGKQVKHGFSATIPKVYLVNAPLRSKET